MRKNDYYSLKFTKQHKQFADDKVLTHLKKVLPREGGWDDR